MVIWEPFVKYENIKFDMCKRLQGQRTKKAFADCVHTIIGEKQAKSVATDDDLMAFRNKLKERKGTK